MCVLGRDAFDGSWLSAYGENTPSAGSTAVQTAAPVSPPHPTPAVFVAQPVAEGAGEQVTDADRGRKQQRQLLIRHQLPLSTTTRFRTVLLAYLDESYDKLEYWLTHSLCQPGLPSLSRTTSMR